jgi:ABC-2 type transport system permease protein/lipopolysaccharide transport system permease protein
MEAASSLREVWQFREVVKNFVSQDLKVKYRRAFLGFFWSLLNPLLHLTVISLVFAMLFKFDVRNYALYVLSGLIPWTFFAATIDGCSMSIIASEGMIKRQYFPKLVFPLSVMTQNLITFGLSLLALLIIIGPFSGFRITPALFILPLSFLCIVAFAFGIGIVGAVLTVYFRDMQHLIGVFMSMWFYLTPIIYPIEAKHQATTAGLSSATVSADDIVDRGPIPLKYRIYFKLNPMYSLIEMFHRPIYDARLPTRRELLAATGTAGIALIIGLLIFRRYEDSLIFNL